MDLLKNIYQLKIQYKVPINEWDYIPPSVLYETDWLGQNGMADYRKIESAFQERGNYLHTFILLYLTFFFWSIDARIKKLIEDIGRMSNDINTLKEEITQLKQSKKDTNTTTSKLTSSKGHKTKDEEKKLINDGGAIKVYGDKMEQEIESSKNVRLLLDDPASKVICSALKKYNIASDWQQYALWIKYGPPDNIQERALAYDEKPLRISQKLKDAKQNPMFVLKSVKDNKPFTPPSSYTNPRIAPPTPHQQQQQQQQHHHQQQDIKSGRVGYEVVVPVMSSSISSPTIATQHSNNSTSSLSTKKNKLVTTPTIEYHNELGLDNAIVNAIFTINNS
ncbi:hypothetical protein RMATCC62417_05002 [Rhizopus microsporus]|nr:hypothetical protein RMATCC62417_05002 [Rhizopus microsporus]